MAMKTDQPPPAYGPVLINPPTNDLTFNPTDTLDEAIAVTLPDEHRFRSLKLVASASIASFVDSISPTGGYAPTTDEQRQSLLFRVRFHGIPCKPESQVFTGTLDVIADGAGVAKKDVKITVPACVSSFVYSAKFICGEQPRCGCECRSVQPGRYATEINIHNFGLKQVDIQKRFVPVVLAGAVTGERRTAHAPHRISLDPQDATMDDCCRIADLLFGGQTPSTMPITIGFLEITSSGPIAVTAVYTTRGLDSAGVSIKVEQIAPTRA